MGPQGEQGLVGEKGDVVSGLDSIIVLLSTALFQMYLKSNCVLRIYRESLEKMALMVFLELMEPRFEAY